MWFSVSVLNLNFFKCWGFVGGFCFCFFFLVLKTVPHTNGDEQVSLVHSTYQIQLESGQGSDTHFHLMNVYLNIYYILGTGDTSELEERCRFCPQGAYSL